MWLVRNRCSQVHLLTSIIISQGKSQEMQILSYPSNHSSDAGDLFVNTSWRKVLSPAHVSITFSALDRWWGCNPYRACSHPTTRVIDAKGLNMGQKLLKMLVLNIKHLTFRLKNLQIRGKSFGEGGVVEMVVSPPLFADQFRKIVCDRLFDTEGRKRDWGINTPPPPIDTELSRYHIVHHPRCEKRSEGGRSTDCCRTRWRGGRPEQSRVPRRERRQTNPCARCLPRPAALNTGDWAVDTSTGSSSGSQTLQHGCDHYPKRSSPLILSLCIGTGLPRLHICFLTSDFLSMSTILTKIRNLDKNFKIWTNLTLLTKFPVRQEGRDRERK